MNADDFLMGEGTPPDEPSAAKHMLTMCLTGSEVFGKSPRIQASRLLEHFAIEGWELVRTSGRRPPEPAPWREFTDRTEGLLAAGIATTRSRTSAAIAELGLDPDDVRAVIIDTHEVRVYRYSDRVTRQTMPIIPEELT